MLLEPLVRKKCVRILQGEIRVNSSSCSIKKGDDSYHVLRLRGKSVTRPQAVLWAFARSWLTCDHINRNQQDDRPENLRWARSSERVSNQSRSDLLV
mmetsp:Transcript_7546/g.13233  ORF Transcript_7546/g.13233 Transcript_7546/m.13233 type:complete len:97 (-) Transcript_7546:614-904(-)